MKICEFKAVYKPSLKNGEHPQILESKALANVFRANYGEGEIEYREKVKCAFLNASLNVICVATIAEGGITDSACDPRIVFQHALLCNAVSVALCHNHPSGSLVPSSQDKEMTENIKKCGEFMKIKLIDHIILSGSDYFSFMEKDMI